MDVTITALVSAIGAAAAAVAATVRWSVTRLVRAQDASTQALLANAESHATLVARFDALAERILELVEPSRRPPRVRRRRRARARAHTHRGNQ